MVIIRINKGRVIFGFGGEALSLAQNIFIVKWFDKFQITAPLGLTITFSRLGTILNFIVSPRIAYVNTYLLILIN